MIKKFMGVFVIVVALTAVMTVSASATVTEYSGDGYTLYGPILYPELPEYDKSVYPYSYIVAYPASYIWPNMGFAETDVYSQFVACSQPFTFSSQETDGSCTYTTEDAYLVQYMYIFGTVPEGVSYPAYEFVELGSLGPLSSYNLPAPFIWSNADILDSSGNTRLEATDPIALDDFTIIQWDGDTDGLVSSGSYYLLGDYENATDGVAVFVDGENLDVGTVFDRTDNGWKISYATDTSSSQTLVVAVDGVGIGGQYFAADGYTRLIAYRPLESPPDQGGSLEPITVFFSSSSLGPESVGLQFDLNGLTSTVNYTWTVTVKDGSGNTVFTNSESITGETNYSGAQFIYDLEPTKTYTADLVVTTAAGQVGSASTSVQTENYAYVIDVDTVSVEGNTAVIDGNIVFPDDLPSQYQTVYLVSTLDTGFEAENDRVAVGSPNFQVYFGDPELTYSTDYTCTLELYYAKSDYTLGVPSGITQEVVFTTDANTSVTPDPEEPTVGDLIDDLKDWNQVTVIPGTVTDKTQQGADLRDEFEKLEKPETDGLVPDVDIDVSPVQGFFDILWGSVFFMTMLVTVVGLAFIRYVLFGKV